MIHQSTCTYKLQNGKTVEIEQNQDNGIYLAVISDELGIVESCCTATTPAEVNAWILRHE